MWFKLTDNTNLGELDHFFTTSFSEKTPIKFIFDARGCNVTFKKVMTLKPLLEKHRSSSRSYLISTKIIMSSKFYAWSSILL